MKPEDAKPEDMVDIKRYAVEDVFTRKENFIVIGLTGLMGSGCSTIAKLLTSNFTDLKLFAPAKLNGLDDTMRDQTTIFRFAREHWCPFSVIKVRSIITTFILENFDQFTNDVYQKSDEKNTTPYERFKDNFRKKIAIDAYSCAKTTISSISSKKNHSESEINASTNLNSPKLQTDIMNESDKIMNAATLMKLMKQYSNFEITDNYPMINLDKLWIDWDKMYCMFCDDKNLDSHTTYEESHSDKKHTTHKKSNSGINDDENKLMAYLLCYILIPAVSDSIHNYLESNGNKYSKMFQDYGNRIRTFGSTVIDRKGITNGSIKNIYAIPERINYFIKALRHPTWSKDVPVRVVIDSIKNLFEITFLRDRYSAFYLVTASKSAEARRSRLVSKKINTSTLELNERPSQARKIYKRFDSLFNLNNNENESDEDVIKGYIKNKTIAPIESDPSKEEIKVKQWEEYGYTPEMMDYCYQIWKNDKIRAQCYLNDLYTFFLQDVEACIQHADIFITVSPNSVDEGQYDLKFTLAKYVMLMMHPGFILPTPIERCMQIAYTAKANSGCLSRQVGAVVTDKQFKILSLGWNDVPCGQVTCIRRNLLNLKKFYDSIAYSDYEKGEEFHKHIDKFDFSDTKQTNTVLDGLPAAYCFKDLYQGITNQRDQTYTRALHGEEKALANCNPVETAGGFLFTTSSPCEMCAKRARDYQISKVFYIEPYPGISQSHIFNSGAPETRTVYELFVGAIGLAYTKLFSPLLPYKDELQLRGFLQNRSTKKPLSEEPKLSEKAPENHRDSDISSPAPNIDSVPVPEPRADGDWSLNALPIGG